MPLLLCGAVRDSGGMNKYIASLAGRLLLLLWAPLAAFEIQFATEVHSCLVPKLRIANLHNVH